VDRMTKWGYFILYTKEILIEDVAYIYVKEIFLRYRSLEKIILDRDSKFIAIF